MRAVVGSGMYCSSSPPSSPPSLGSTSSWSREASPLPRTESDPDSSPPHAIMQHPFAATSSSAGMRPPKYYAGGKRTRRPRRPSNLSEEMIIDEHDAGPTAQRAKPADHTSDEEDIEMGMEFEETDDDRSARLWEDAISEAIDNLTSTVDLSNEGLTLISPCVEDLGKLVVLDTNAFEPTPFSRTSSVASDVTVRGFARSSSSAAFSRSGSQSVLWGATRDGGINLFLRQNLITCLPPELFALSDRLTVLSLAKNRLEKLPAAIGYLSALRELNVASNRLRTLPVELDRLHLTTFSIEPNPLMRPPPEYDSGPVLEAQTLPTLKEYAFRVLLDPVRNVNGHSFAVSEVERHGDVAISPDDGDILTPTDVQYCAAYNVCPTHGRHFVTPGHTVIEFRARIASCIVSGLVPVEIRGCLPGCLDNLPQTSAAVISERDEDDEFLADFPA